jgi:hypothetical protein
LLPKTSPTHQDPHCFQFQSQASVQLCLPVSSPSTSHLLSIP